MGSMGGYGVNKSTKFESDSTEVFTKGLLKPFKGKGSVGELCMCREALLDEFRSLEQEGIDLCNQVNSLSAKRTSVLLRYFRRKREWGEFLSLNWRVVNSRGHTIMTGSAALDLGMQESAGNASLRRELTVWERQRMMYNAKVSAMFALIRTVNKAIADLEQVEGLFSAEK